MPSETKQKVGLFKLFSFQRLHYARIRDILNGNLFNRNNRTEP